MTKSGICRRAYFCVALSFFILTKVPVSLSEMTEEVVQQWMHVLGNGSDYAFDLVLDGKGNVYVTGATGDNFTTVKYDPNGNEVYVRSCSRFQPGYWKLGHRQCNIYE